jgi:hypothetical protein
MSAEKTFRSTSGSTIIIVKKNILREKEESHVPQLGVAVSGRAYEASKPCTKEAPVYSLCIYIAAMACDNQHKSCRKTLDPLKTCIHRDSHPGIQAKFSVEHPASVKRVSHHIILGHDALTEFS